MRIILTAKEIMDLGLWSRTCDRKGFNPYAVNEGLIESNDDLEFTEDEAIEIGFIKVKP